MTQKQEQKGSQGTQGESQSTPSGVETTSGAQEKVGKAETGIERRHRGAGIERPSRGGGLMQPDIWSSPFSFMHRMLDEMDRMFTRFGGGIVPSSVFELGPENIWSPVIETFERDGKLVLRADLPGLKADDVKVEVDGDELVVSGERKKEEKRTTEGGYYSERRYGSFERRMTLPEGCNPDTIEASFDNGVLEVSLETPEQAGQKKRKIEVRSGQQEGSPRSVH